MANIRMTYNMKNTRMQRTHEISIHLSQEEDVHIWKLDGSGNFSKSAYRAFFNGAIPFEHWRRLWKSWAPSKCKVFLWLAIWNRCWTADRLARRGLPHLPKCPLCDQEEEDIQHLLTTCVFSRDFWFRVLAPLGLKIGFQVIMKCLLQIGGEKQ